MKNNDLSFFAPAAALWGLLAGAILGLMISVVFFRPTDIRFFEVFFACMIVGAAVGTFVRRRFVVDVSDFPGHFIAPSRGLLLRRTDEEISVGQTFWKAGEIRFVILPKSDEMHPEVWIKVLFNLTSNEPTQVSVKLWLGLRAGRDTFGGLTLTELWNYAQVSHDVEQVLSQSFRKTAEGDAGVAGVLSRDYNELDKFAHILHDALGEVRWPLPEAAVDWRYSLTVRRDRVSMSIE